MATKTTTVPTRTLNECAMTIHRECQGKSWYMYAEAYVSAMATLADINQPYYYDSGESVVLYALSNLQSWRGEVAKSVKADLRAHLTQAEWRL